MQTISQKSINTDNTKAKLLANYVWPILIDMYSIFKLKYGDTPSSTWIACLRNLDESQIKTGLAACLERYPEYPPGASMFRALCEGRCMDSEGNESSWQHKSEAYTDFNSPAHPSYEPKRIDSDEQKDKRNQKAKTELGKLKSILGVRK